MEFLRQDVTSLVTHQETKNNIYIYIYIYIYISGHAVARLVEAQSYKPDGRGFDSRWCNLNIS